MVSFVQREFCGWNGGLCENYCRWFLSFKGYFVDGKGVSVRMIGDGFFRTGGICGWVSSFYSP